MRLQKYRIYLLGLLSFFALAALSAPAHAACLRPDGVEGEIVYIKNTKIVQYCDGENWIGMGWKGGLSQAAGMAGAIQFNDGAQKLGADDRLIWQNNSLALTDSALEYRTPITRPNEEGHYVSFRTCLRSYNVNATTSAPLLDCDGAPLLTGTARTYKLTAWVSGTGTQTGATAVVKMRPESKLMHVGYEAGTSSNHVHLFMDGDVPTVKLYTHASFYDVNVLTEELAGTTGHNANFDGTGIVYARGTNFSSAQLSIGTATPVNSAQLQMDSTSRGFLPPRMTTAQINNINNPAAGLMVYDSTLNVLKIYNGSAWRTVTF